MGTPKVKIFIRFETSTPGEYEFESLWATPTSEGYELDNIPFYASSLAYRDVVSADPAPGGLLEFGRLVRASGHSTIRLWITELESVERIREEFRAMGCTSELSDQGQLVAVDIPPNVPYSSAKMLLDKGEESGQFEYQEGCLGQDPSTTN
jgi:hypothetical protein